MRNNYLLLLLLCISTLLSAQTPSKIMLMGVVKDSTGETIAQPTVMLLNPKDSALVNFTRGDANGAFTFKNVKNTAYLFKVSYPGYLPLQVYLPASNKEINDLGTVTIKPISSALMEVVIKTARSTLSIRGDTIEYDASSFKVPPGSTVEDLLRRLPGLEVDAAGNVRAQGQDVKRVYVNGKSFFGDDPKAATKNLGAETLSKIQVYNEKSEQAKLTGVDDGKKEKAMNLELKDEYKKGKFGKVTGAVGTEERWAARGNYNRFNPKEQFSIIGYANNINQTGLNWEDYGEFKGQNTFNDNDNGDFGFGGGGGRFYFSGNDGIRDNFDGKGFTENGGGGLNYNYEHKKNKFNASYFYNQTDLNLDEFGLRQNLLSDTTFFNADTSFQNNFRSNHNLNTRLEQNLDSMRLLIVKATGRFSQNQTSLQQSQRFFGSNGLTSNRLDLNNGTDLNSWRFSGSAIFRNRFKKKGRSLAASFGYNDSHSDITENIFSLNRFFQANTFTDQIRQLNTNISNTRQLKSSLLFTESFAKKWYSETFYNFAHTANDINRQVVNPERNNESITNLSVFYDNTVLYNRFGSSIRYSDKGSNLSVGAAVQQIGLEGIAATAPGLPPLGNPIRRTFTNLTPNVDFSHEFEGNTWINISYGYQVREPRFNDLQPVPNVNNPLFQINGNPNLGPERLHDIDFNFNRWNSANQSSIGMGGNFQRFDSQIVYNQRFEKVEKVGIRTITTPDNLSGGQRFNMYLWSSFPLVKTKLTMGVNGDINAGNTPAFIGDEQNNTRNQSYGTRVSLNLTPFKRLIFSTEGSARYNQIRYSIQENLNQNIYSYEWNSSVKAQILSKLFFESNFKYTNFRNDRFDLNQSVPIWNASLRQILGKQNRVEIRLAAFDLLNRNVSINQSGTQNFITQNIANTLARYFMLSASYNLKGYENKLKKNNGWW